MVYVTHDQVEAMTLAIEFSMVAISQLGTPHELYHDPANRLLVVLLPSSMCLDGIEEGVVTGIRPMM